MIEKKPKIRFRASQWFDINAQIPLFGVQVKVDKGPWCNAREGKDILLFEDEGERDAKLEDLKAKYC